MLSEASVTLRAQDPEGAAAGVTGPHGHWLGRDDSQRLATVPHHLGGFRRRPDRKPAHGHRPGRALPVAGHRLQHPSQVQAQGKILLWI